MCLQQRKNPDKPTAHYLPSTKQLVNIVEHFAEKGVGGDQSRARKRVNVHLHSSDGPKHDLNANVAKCLLDV